jgi:hypothetical protein
MNKEIWKPIDNYLNYMVSNFGRIKNINYRGTGKTKFIKGTKHNNYTYITLSKNNKLKAYLLHRLVAEAFIPNPENKPCINHKDCNRQNNRTDNLEWCTQKENIQYMDKLKRRVANKKLNEEEVKIIKEIKKQGYSYKKVWELFKNKITLSGFEKIWYGQNWKKGE